MFNKKYKKGIADAAKAYEAFGQKQSDAIKYILEEVRQGKRDLEAVLRELNGNIDGIYDYLQSKEKAKVYTVYTPFDLKELDQHARLFLVGVLLALTMDKRPNEDQQNYFRAVMNYLEIKDPPFGTNPMAIENVEDIPTQKAIYQTILEYLQLQDGDNYDETEYQQEFLDAFNLNDRIRKEIKEHVELLYTATGARGLAEKYGYVPEEKTGDTDDEHSSNSFDQTGQACEISPEQEKNIDIFVGAIGPHGWCIFETKNYLLGYSHWSAEDYHSWFRLNKFSGEKLRYRLEKIGLYGIPRDFAILDDTIYFDENHALTAFDASTMKITTLAPISSYISSISACGDKIVFVEHLNRKVYMYDLTARKHFEIPGFSYCISVFAVQSGVYIISDQKLKLYDYKIKETTIIAEKISGCALLYCNQSGIFYIFQDNTIKRICVTEATSIGNWKCTLMEHVDRIIHAYKDCLIFAAPGGKIEKLDYETGETTTLADDAQEFNYRKGSLFRKSSSWYTPVGFERVGNYIYYFPNGDSGRVCKLSIADPHEKEIISRDRNSFEKGIIDKTGN